MDAYDAPDTDSPRPFPVSTPAMVLTVLCFILGFIGVLMTCCSSFGVVWGQIAPSVGGMDPAQAEMMRAIQEQQGWWVVPLSLMQMTAKMVLSIGLIAGAGLVLASKPSGRGIFRPVLIYGIVLELGMGLWGAGYTALNFDTMGEQFSDAMAANPDMPPGFEDMAGPMFGTLMAVGMVIMLGWALLKAALYGATWFTLAPPELDRGDTDR